MCDYLNLSLGLVAAPSKETDLSLDKDIGAEPQLERGISIECRSINDTRPISAISTQ